MRLHTMLVFGDQIDERFLQNIGGAARLHDLGNLSLPLELLRKPGPLSADETALMRSHVEAGQQWLAALHDKAGTQGVIALAGTVIAAHHERYDGTGYPSGLHGEQIPLAGRLVAVADAWVAMTSPRPYRDAMTSEAVRAVMAAEAGKQFDPQVVEALWFVLDQDAAF